MIHILEHEEIIMKPQWIVERKYKMERLEIYQLVEICTKNEI